MQCLAVVLYQAFLCIAFQLRFKDSLSVNPGRSIQKAFPKKVFFIYRFCRQFLPVIRLMMLKDIKGETIMKKFAVLLSVMLIFSYVFINFVQAGRIGKRQVRQ